MVESLSGQAYGGFRPAAPGEVAAFHDPRTFMPHDFPETQVDLGEVVLNYAQAGSPAKPALLLIPGQTESWWGYEKAMPILARDFQVFAVDVRGQGRSSWTPGRYTLDNMGNDLVRFIATVIGRPVVVSGCSSGGLLSAWLSAFALPGQIRGAVYEDPPLFASEVSPLHGPSLKQAIGPMFRLNAAYLGDQWRIGDWQGLKRAAAVDPSPFLRMVPFPEEPPQNLKEYDPEWGRAFWEGTVARSAPHEMLLSQVKVPVLLTHHARFVNPETGHLFGAMADLQAAIAQDILRQAGVAVTYASLPDAAHAMHAAQPERFAALVTDWAKGLPS